MDVDDDEEPDLLEERGWRYAVDQVYLPCAETAGYVSLVGTLGGVILMGVGEGFRDLGVILIGVFVLMAGQVATVMDYGILLKLWLRDEKGGGWAALVGFPGMAFSLIIALTLVDKGSPF